MLCQKCHKSRLWNARDDENRPRCHEPAISTCKILQLERKPSAVNSEWGSPRFHFCCTECLVDTWHAGDHSPVGREGGCPVARMLDSPPGRSGSSPQERIRVEHPHPCFHSASVIICCIDYSYSGSCMKHSAFRSENAEPALRAWNVSWVVI